MWQGYEWPAFLRFWTETLSRLLRQYAENEGTRSAELLPDVIGPVIDGTGIVMTVSFLERVILDELIRNDSEINRVNLINNDWATELGMNMEWSGWPLIEALTRLRHCFAHEYGRATRLQLRHLQNISNDLLNQPVEITWGNHDYSIGQFFSVDPESENIILLTTTEPASSLSPGQSIRIITLSFLEQLEQVGVVDLQEWRDGAG